MTELPGGNESAYSAGDLGSVPGLEDPLEKGMVTHSSILAWRIPRDRGPWRATIHGAAKSWTQLSDFDFASPLVAQTVKNLPAMWETWVRYLG